MNREMHKKERQATPEQAREMLLNSKEGTLAINGNNGYPYALPVNYIYLNDAIYIHTAAYGYKIDALKKDPKVCFSVIVHSEVAPELFTTKYKSVIAYGDAEFVEAPQERMLVMETFVARFSPGLEERGMKFIKAAIDRTAIIKINIQEMKGKMFRE